MTASETLHSLVQYLSGVAIAYIPQREDDSHTNLEWSIEHTSFVTGELDKKGLVLGLDALDLRLWFNREELEFDFIGSQHGEVLRWINQSLHSFGLEEKDIFSFHYDYPSHHWDEMKMVVEMTEDLHEELELHAHLRNTSLLAIQEVWSDIRSCVWPHHFDTGILEVIQTEKGELLKSISAGMGIPDELCDLPYIYVNGWSKNS